MLSFFVSFYIDTKPIFRLSLPFYFSNLILQFAIVKIIYDYVKKNKTTKKFN